MKQFPYYKQPGEKDCGPTCLKIISKYYNQIIPLEKLRDLSDSSRTGTTFYGLSKAAEKIGLRSIGVKTDFRTFKNEVPLPCIVHWKKYHFVVVYKIHRGRIYISDPSFGLINYSESEFLEAWIGKNSKETTQEGLVLILETTPLFYDNNWNSINEKSNYSFLLTYFGKYRALFIQLLVGLLAGSLLQLIFPFLTQSIVDIGIQNQDLGFIQLILLAQILLFLGEISINSIRGWILLHLSTRINISLVSDFFVKLMKMPISFFDTRMTGDILQRINDHSRIERFLTNSSLTTLFSTLNIIVFSIVLIYYDFKIFSIFAIGSILLVLWIIFFLKRRKKLDYMQFDQSSDEQSKTIELIEGMQEIKLNNSEQQKRWGWEFVQIRLFKIAIKELSLEQMQSIGSTSINQFKNILITFTSASLVIKGEITLGMMLSIQYIIGQLNAPLTQLLSFIQDFQDAKISLERLNEIHNRPDEENISEYKVKSFMPDQDLIVKNLMFKYRGSSENLIENLDLIIPHNKITAIVGASGSGKTTLMKILMRFYEPSNGEIYLGKIKFTDISLSEWRNQCGVVMQEGYLFNDTIANNIALGDTLPDQKRLLQAVKTANLDDLINKLPIGFNTKIGNEGLGLSGGEKQRLLIARAVYKNPAFLFFDEATSSLDANNEKVIMSNLDDFFKGRTAVVIAHRLSTVKNAHQIIVMDNGSIQEVGGHDELLANKGPYYQLIRNQLKL